MCPIMLFSALDKVKKKIRISTLINSIDLILFLIEQLSDPIDIKIRDLMKNNVN